MTSDKDKARLEVAEQAYWADDHATAFRLYRRLAMSGIARAQHRLGCMFDFGRGVRENKPLAVRWYRAAAEAGDPDAQHHLACCFLDGDGVPMDLAEAARWFRRSAQQGDGMAQFELGRLYERGEGVPRDLRRAVHWYRLAAWQEVDAATTRLALILSTPAPASSAEPCEPGRREA